MNNRHKTAITRKKPSKPMRIFENLVNCQLPPQARLGMRFRISMLTILVWLSLIPFYPEVPTGLFDMITCNYVLNVIPDQAETGTVLRDIQAHLADQDSMAYISVRRDLKHDTNTQFLVELNLPTVYKDSATVIYLSTEGR